jgi:hypothetical protein
MRNSRNIVEAMVYACLRELDVLRQQNFMLLNVDIKLENQSPVTTAYKLTAMVKGREPIAVRCELYQERIGFLYISSEHHEEEMGFRCDTSRDGFQVWPWAGPRSYTLWTLGHSERGRLIQRLGAVESEWRVWPCDGGYAAFRQTWLFNDALKASTLRELTDAIILYEYGVGNAERLPDRTRESIGEGID